MDNKLLGVAVVGESPDLSSLLDKYVISRDSGPVPVSFKIVRSGQWIEIYEYEHSIFVNTSHIKYEPPPPPDYDTQIVEALVGLNPFRTRKNEPSEECQKYRVSRAKTNMRRLIQSNFDKAGKLLTLTFRDTDRFDIRSLSACHSRLTYFYKQLRKSFPDCKFVAVPEFQQRGAVHYHLIIDLPYVPIENLRSLWPYGFININVIHNPAKVGGYIAKYLAKNIADPRFAHHRCYSSSTNLIKPRVEHAMCIDELLKKFDSMNVQACYKKEFWVEFRGHIKYSSYNLYQMPAQRINDGQS